MKKSMLSIAGMLVIGVLAFVYMGGTLGLPVSRESDDRRATMEVSDGNGLVPPEHECCCAASRSAPWHRSVRLRVASRSV